MSRRRALALLGVGTASVAAGTAGLVLGVGGNDRLRPGAAGESLRQPIVLNSQNGVLDVALTAGPGVRLAGRNTSAWGFNGTCPGPTLRVRPGDLLSAVDQSS
jgi:FtsP/CotA-like multicopper oxidase with cupredoxin domain